LVVVVQDNGKGFNPAVVKAERNGLTNMAQRMRELGGHCLVTSQPGQGCRVEFGIPFKHPQQNSWAWIWNLKRFPNHPGENRSNRTDESSQNHDPTQC
jgi:hypothetical protein